MGVRSVGLILTLVLAACTPAAPETHHEGEAVARSGDMIAIGRTELRLFGIDAFDPDQICEDGQGGFYRCGDRAKAALADAVAGRVVACDVVDTDHYDRLIARCFVEGRDLGEAIVRQGLALDFTRYSAGAYAEAQTAAETAKAGAWAGRFTTPEEWRTQSRRR